MIFTYFKKPLRYIILSGISLYSGMVLSQTQTENYIYIQEPTVPVTSIGLGTGAIRSIEYFDGLGRPKQQISVQATPEKTNLVVPVEYDGFGRQVKEYLPIPVQGNGLTYIEEPDQGYYSTQYGTDYGYSEKVLESSPLNRVLKQAAPGDDWAKGSGHEIEFQYDTNTAQEVRRYSIRSIQPGQRSGSLIQPSYYPSGTLYKTTIIDENGHQTEEFKDKQNQVVLKRSYIQNQKLDTYYLYDLYGNLTHVIPPLAAKEANLSTALQDALCYSYQYDQRNRMIEKKLPGKAPEYMVYDKQDRLVAVQDGNLREQGLWLFTKYDAFGRMVYTGLFSAGSPSNVQTQADSFQANNEARTASGFSKNGLTIYYTQQAFPATFSEVWQVTYYDSYANLGFTLPTSVMGETELRKTPQETKGLQTAEFVNVLGKNIWESTFMAYDKKSRPVGSYKTNFLGGYTTVESELNFSGLPVITQTRHKKTPEEEELIVEEKFTYDHMLRLLKHIHIVNGRSQEVLSQNKYDELGQLIEKEVGGTNRALQRVDYRYNIRGWLTHLNNINNLSLSGQSQQDLFAFKINYNNLAEAHPDVAPLYNGNISQTFWRTASDNIMRSYGYTYDDVNRLKDALYKIPNSAVNHSYNEQVSYDLNGNITALKRYGMVESNVETIMIDDLTYEYEGNQLENVTDATTYSEGFKDGNIHSQTHQNDYEYDVNGNMVKDRNKAITEITYNHLNLPQKITFGSLGTIEYIYNSNGEKLQKKVKAGTKTHITEYLGGFQYLNGELSFFPTAEGYVKASKLASSFSGEGGSYAYNYVYNYTDHLGNIRLRYTQDPEDQSKIRILEEDHYYPFGLKHKGYNSDHQIIASPTDPVRPNPVVIIPVTPELGDVYKYKYNGKELQDELGLDWYDYGARNYDAAIGRWMNMDPLAEEYPGWSPYNYTLLNPVKLVDPDGRAPEDIIIRYKNSSGENKTINYSMGMNYEGSNKFVSNTVSSLNKMSETNSGKKVLQNLISSDNKFNIKNNIYKSGVASFIPNKANNTFKGGDVNLGETQSLGTVAHELFHGYQYEKTGDGYSIGSELGAFLFEDSVLEDYYTQNPGLYSMSGGGMGLNSKEGREYSDAYEGLFYNSSFDSKTFDKAIRNFKRGAQINVNGDYNKFPMNTESKDNLIQDFYPLSQFSK